MISDYERWKQLQHLFHLAEASPEADLDTLLEAACDDPETRSHARRLIEAARNSSKAEPATPLHPTIHRIGPYSIVRLLGAGGNGRVYLGERLVGGAVQRVAVKVLSRSAAGSGFTERFAREQHILASLNHANITRMLDAGISDGGEPYLVMEYVDGEHLDTWCDENKLGIPERLQLFLHVCEPVAYAHRNLVVHLDLKPSNVLIAREDRAVKLLDFGTSKLVRPDSLLTTTVMATPAYASPEQLLNQPVTTVCDVYALGAVLFELLSGKRPNRDSSVALLIERSMKEAAPESLHEAVTQEAADCRALTQTRLRVELEGDLETIVTKCLAARPRDRYATVDALMEDVQRYLVGRPILARPQTTTYRLGKFVRRNRTAVAAGTVMGLCLLGVTGYAAWRQHQAFQQGQRALQMQTFMSQLFKVANTNYMGKPAATVPELLQLGVRLLPELITDSADRRAAQLSLAKSMFDDDDLTDARKVFNDIIQSAKDAGDVPRLAEAEAYRGTIAYRQGDTATGAGLLEDALRLSDKAGVTPEARIRIKTYYVENRLDRGFGAAEDEALLRSAVTESRTQGLPERDQAWAGSVLAQYLRFSGDIAEAKVLANQSLAVYKRESYALCDQADMRVLLADIQGLEGDVAGSIPVYKQAYADFRSCSGDSSANTLLTQARLARVMLKVGQGKEVISMLEPSLPVWRKAFPNSPDISEPLVFLAKAYLQTSQFPQAEAAAKQALQVIHGKVEARSAQTAVLELLLAQALQGQGRLGEALHHAEIADSTFAAVPSTLAGEKRYAAQAHQLMLDLQKKN
jgi:eukaryotic-like serine/threonine-protein kinase